MASSSEWNERQGPPPPTHPPRHSVSEILGTPEHPKILPGATPQWPGHENGPSPVPPKPEPLPGLPAAVRRPLEELEQLRDDALAQRNASADARLNVYANFRKEAAVAEGVWTAMCWLLGERQASPISQEWHEYPFVGRVVGRERSRALDCIERNAWLDVDEDYGAGVLHGLEWAMSPHKKRPVPAG
ncbi:hypothetical protein [Streptomyces sp. NPDC005408]|uniref:hypothetical protein n=1 Tax=Streptomyces sp. NPDC005408 TaxID=3155341 RepID=UPI0033A95DB0